MFAAADQDVIQLLHLPLLRVVAMCSFAIVYIGSRVAHLMKQRLNKHAGLSNICRELVARATLPVRRKAQDTATGLLLVLLPLDALPQATIENHVVKQAKQRLGQSRFTAVKALLAIAERKRMTQGKRRVRYRDNQS